MQQKLTVINEMVYITDIINIYYIPAANSHLLFRELKGNSLSGQRTYKSIN